MKIIYFIILCFLFFTFSSAAQSVTVLDSLQKTPISGANILIYEVSNGRIEKQGVTDVNGVFFTTITNDSHILYMSISAIGYKKVTLQPTAGKQNILLAPDPKQLNEVKITANKSALKFNGNIMEFDISQVPNADYLNLSDIIGQLPFLQVTVDGNIKMMDENLKILIDNLPHAVYKDAFSLKSLPPQAIDKIEVVLVPTARNGGKTLNITLKRDYFLGWNGSADVSGTRLGVAPMGSVSYWRKKIGFDISTNYSYNENDIIDNIVINYHEARRQLNSSSKSHDNLNRGGVNFSSYYNLNDRSSIDMQIRLSSNKIDFLNNSKIDIYSGSTVDNGFSSIDGRTSILYSSASLNYTYKYKKPGNVLYFLSNFSNSTSNGNQILNSFINNENGLIRKLSINEIKSSETTFEVLQQHNSNKKIRYTFGAKLIMRNNKNDHSINIDESLIFTPVRMQQTVSSIYSDADWTINKFTANAGLRFDYNDNIYTHPIVLKQSFAKITPVVSLTYNINPIHLLLLSYSRRITRPGFYATLPVTNPVNAYEERTGTANLYNQVSNDWGIQYYGNYKLARIGFNFGYGCLRGAIRDVSILDTANTIQTFTTNVDLNESYTVGFSADFKLFKSLRFSHLSNFSYILQHNDNSSSRNWSGYLSDRVNYQLNEKNSFSFSLLSYSPNINLQGVEQSMSYLNWSVSYGYYFNLMKNFPTAISLNLSNLNLYNGLPGYSTVNSQNFSKRQDTKKSNAVVGVSIRIQFKGKKYANRTFNKVKSIQNNDLSSPSG